MAWDHPDSIEEWLSEAARDMPPHMLLELIEQCIAELEGDGPTIH